MYIRFEAVIDQDDYLEQSLKKLEKGLEKGINTKNARCSTLKEETSAVKRS